LIQLLLISKVSEQAPMGWHSISMILVSGQTNTSAVTSTQQTPC